MAEPARQALITRPIGGLLRIATAMATIVVPAGCIGCNRPAAASGGLCAACWHQLRLIEKPYCRVLGSPFAVDIGDEILCAGAIAEPPVFERLRAVAIYQDLAVRLVSDLKFADRTDLAPWLARWMIRAGAELVNDCDVVVPVPLHRSRLLLRRFNQSAELARAIARQAKVKFAPQYLTRTRRTRRQIGLGANERRRNLAGAFCVADGEKANVAGKRVLLIDDVYTTGATASAATRAMLRAGAAAVDVVVFAKVA